MYGAGRQQVDRTAVLVGSGPEGGGWLQSTVAVAVRVQELVR